MLRVRLAAVTRFFADQGQWGSVHWYLRLEFGSDVFFSKAHHGEQEAHLVVTSCLDSPMGSFLDSSMGAATTRVPEGVGWCRVGIGMVLVVGIP